MKMGIINFASHINDYFRKLYSFIYFYSNLIIFLTIIYQNSLLVQKEKKENRYILKKKKMFISRFLYFVINYWLTITIVIYVNMIFYNIKMFKGKRVIIMFLHLNTSSFVVASIISICIKSFV